MITAPALAPDILSEALVRGGVPLVDFLRPPYEPVFTLSFVASPGSLRGAPIFLCCGPSGWQGYTPRVPSDTLLDFFAQHEDSFRDSVLAMSDLDAAAMAALEDPFDRFLRLRRELAAEHREGATELAKLVAHERFWAGRTCPTAAAAMPLALEAQRSVADPLWEGYAAATLLEGARRWAAAWR